jgi:hypothetical protein
MFPLTVQFICELQQNIRHFVILFVSSATENGIFDIVFEAEIFKVYSLLPYIFSYKYVFSLIIHEEAMQMHPERNQYGLLPYP